MPDNDLISPLELLPHLFDPVKPILIDVSLDEDVAADPFLLPGAIRCNHTSIEDLLPAIANREAVVICQKGLKLSRGAASILRSHGLVACALEGGNYGWTDLGLPRTPATGGEKLWVAASDAEQSHFVAGWCISRVIAPLSRIIWVTSDIAEAVCDRFDGNLVPDDPLRALDETDLNWNPLRNVARMLSSPSDLVLSRMIGGASLAGTTETRFSQLFSVFDLVMKGELARNSA